MCRSLRGLKTSDSEIDVAVALTEGLVSGMQRQKKLTLKK
jgi:hypothetical protein